MFDELGIDLELGAAEAEVPLVAFIRSPLLGPLLFLGVDVCLINHYVWINNHMMMMVVMMMMMMMVMMMMVVMMVVIMVMIEKLKKMQSDRQRKIYKIISFI